MKKVLMILLCAVMCVSCMTAAAGCSAYDTDEEAGYEDGSSAVYGEVVEGKEAPDFTTELVGGEEFTLSDHKDEVVFLNFWATWCGYCVQEMPDIQQLEDDDIAGLRIIEVNCVEQRGTVDEFVRENGYTMDFAYDENGDISTVYPTHYLPCTVIVKGGIVRKIIQGAPAEPYDAYKSMVMECIQS